MKDLRFGKRMINKRSIKRFFCAVTKATLLTPITSLISDVSGLRSRMALSFRYPKRNILLSVIKQSVLNKLSNIYTDWFNSESVGIFCVRSDN